MLEVIVFAITLVVSEVIGGFIIVNLMMSERFLKKYTKKMMKLMKSLEDMDLDDFE